MLTRTLCASALLACAGGAFAQSAHEEHRQVIVEKQHADHNGSGVFHWTSDDDDGSNTVNESEDVTLIYSPAQRGSGMRTTYLNGKTTVKLLLDDNRVSDVEVTINGERVNDARGKIENGTIVVFTPGGKTLAQFSAPNFDGAKHEITWHAQPERRSALTRVREDRDAQREVRIHGLAEVSPKAENRRVIGIFASTPSEALAAQLGLEPDQVIVVESVNEGMPAQRAGLKRYDIITDIDGQPPANLDRLREVISSKGDGDPIRLTLLRGGQKQQVEIVPISEGSWEIEIETDDNDAEDMPFGRFFNNLHNNRELSPQQRARVEEAMVHAQEIMETQRERLSELQEEMHERMLEMSERLQGQLAEQGTVDEIREAYQSAIRELSSVDVQRQLEQALARVREAVETTSSGSNRELQLRRLPRIEFLERNNDGRDVIVAPAAPSAPAAPRAPRAPSQLRSANDDARMKSLEERMERIERLLERIADDRDR